MKVTECGNGIIVKDVKDFNITQTLECGQCFHFEKLGEQEYAVVHGKHLLHIKQSENDLFCENVKPYEFETIWIPYFDLNRDYQKIKQSLLKSDEKLKAAIEENAGVRILNQELEETLLSFVISQNKQIPHIKKIVKDISEKYGDFLGRINDMDFYSFPDKVQLKNITEEKFRECKTGFRAPYLVAASEKLLESGFESERLKSVGYENAKEKLLTIKGVGEKVANCVLLFSLGYRNAFPVDVWIKRIMESMYFEKSVNNSEVMKTASEKFGEYGGYAQQYLFYYARKNNLKNEKNKKIRV